MNLFEIRLKLRTVAVLRETDLLKTSFNPLVYYRLKQRNTVVLFSIDKSINLNYGFTFVIKMIGKRFTKFFILFKGLLTKASFNIRIIPNSVHTP